MNIVTRTWKRGVIGKLIVGFTGLTGITACCCASTLIVAIVPRVTTPSRFTAPNAPLVAAVPTQQATSTTAPPTKAPTTTALPTKQPTATAEPTAEPTAAPTDPPATATPEPTAPAAPVVAAADGPANVRSGPGAAYAIVGSLAQGESAPITGKSSGGQWWQIDIDGTPGWVRGDVVAASGVLDAVAVAEAPPLPTVAATVAVATDTPVPAPAQEVPPTEVPPTIEVPPTESVVEAAIAAPAPEPAAVAAPAGNCHPSYPTVCIPPAPPDLDCPDIPFRRFAVVGSDPHRFDGDNDGIGCES